MAQSQSGAWAACSTCIGLALKAGSRDILAKVQRPAPHPRSSHRAGSKQVPHAVHIPYHCCTLCVAQAPDQPQELSRTRPGPTFTTYGMQGCSWRTCCKYYAQASPGYMLYVAPVPVWPCKLDSARGRLNFVCRLASCPSDQMILMSLVYVYPGITVDTQDLY